jgi:hypothetical protein
MGEGKMAEAGAKRHFSSTRNFSCTLVCFVFQFVGKDIFCVSRATFFLFVVVIVCYLRASPHNSSKMVSTLYLLGERERERSVLLLSQRGRRKLEHLLARYRSDSLATTSLAKTSTDGTERRYHWCQPLYHRN